MPQENKSLKEVIKYRLEKLNKIKKFGINPFPYSYDASNSVTEILLNEKTFLGKKIKVAGRIISLRKMG